MSREESNTVEFKSLKKAIGTKSDVASLAETCVCFANAQGGKLIIGIEDKYGEPPENQKLNKAEINQVIVRLRTLTQGVVIVNPKIHRHENGGEFISLTILPATRTIATTSSGKVFIRIADNCHPVGSEELTDLAAEKNAFQWELVVSKNISLEMADLEQISSFISAIKESERVSDFIKQKSNREILEYYQMISEDGFLTNLGVLWLGKPSQRAKLAYPITFQYLVYNQSGEKIREKKWHYHLHNPMQLLQEIEKEAMELNYTSEFPDGIFRKSVRNYPKEVIRELLINSFSHKRFTTAGDIFLEVHPDHIVFTNPGGLPVGISKNNILHERHRRNPHLMNVFQDLKLMEGEGSGYDLIYEKLSADAKPFPEIESTHTKFVVTIRSSVVNKDALSVIDYINRHFHLSQKEIITLGLIAKKKKILATQLSIPFN